MEASDILLKLGSPGKYAIIVYSLCYVAFYYVVFSDIFPSIYGAVPSHRCHLPPGTPLNTSLPRGDSGQLSSCEVYENYTVDSGVTVTCPMGWVYDVGAGEATVPTEV